VAEQPSRRRYSDDERAAALAALAANGGNVPLTARQLDIPEQTLRNWTAGRRHPEASQMGDEKRPPLADAFEALAGKLLDGITPAKITETGVKDLTTSAAIAVDKMRLLREQPTSISDVNLPDEERRARLAAYLERLGAGGADEESRAGGAAGHVPGGPGADPPSRRNGS
jgi:hypothetical protein